jgi:hypothetical protein
MEYIRDGSTLPVPFNIIPTPKSLIDIFRNIKKRIQQRNANSSDTNGALNQLAKDASNETRRISMGGTEITYNVSCYFQEIRHLIIEQPQVFCIDISL